MNAVESKAATLDAKGRVVIPAEVRKQAGIRENAVLTSRDIGPGSILIVDANLVHERIWEAAPSNRAQYDPQTVSKLDVDI